MSLFFSLSSITQILVVVSADWDAVDGSLYRFQRSQPSQSWELIGEPIPITLGKHGMAWGRGVIDLSQESGLSKKEGDQRSPAGIFRLGPIFGDRDHCDYAQKMPFLLITEDLECVDDPDSVYYNQFVTKNTVAIKDWKSSEKMQEIGALYAIGLVVQHNIDPIEAGKGSAIFMHIWRGKGQGTGGCTAMAESDLNEIVSWLDQEKSPCLIQLPLEEYKKREKSWGLPQLDKKVFESYF